METTKEKLLALRAQAEWISSMPATFGRAGRRLDDAIAETWYNGMENLVAEDATIEALVEAALEDNEDLDYSFPELWNNVAKSLGIALDGDTTKA